MTSLNMLTEDDIKNALKAVKYPGYSRDIVSFGLVKQVATKNGAAEGLSIVEQFKCLQGARSELATQLGRSRASRNYAAFRVSGIPGARGFDLSDRRSSGHNVVFTDGPYYYLVGTGTATGTPRAPTRADTIDAAFRLYRRVHG